MRIQRWLGVAATATALLVSSPGLAAAQGLTTGAISGVVTEAGGRPLENVQLEIRNASTGFRAGALTRANGRFFVQGLQVGGPYTVTARMLGYSPVTRGDLRVSLGGNTVADFQLAQAAAQIAGVTVTADLSGAEFSPTRQGVSTVVADTLVRRMPTLQRDFTDLVKLTPQVARPTTDGPSAGGVYNRYNNYTVDGVNQNDRFNLGSSGGQPGGATGGRIMSQEAVKEFQVLLSPTDVRYGNFAGMLVNAVTRTGTNTWEGGATYTFRTPEMAADTNFIRNADFKVRQYGLSLGGPIIRDRLHFFIAPEFQQRSDPATGPSADVASNRAGDVSLDSIARITQIMQGRGLDIGNAGFFRRENPLSNLFGRLDWQINENHRVGFRQLYNTAESDAFSRNTNAFNTNVLQQNSGIRLTSNVYTTRNTNASSALQVFSNGQSGWSNELSVGYNTIEDRRVTPVSTPEIAVAVTPIGGTSANRAVTFGTERFSPGNKLQQRIFELSNNFTLPVGSHTLTFGGRYERTYIYNFFLSGAANGAFIFPSIDRLEAGTPSGYVFSYANGGDIAAEFNGQQITGYAQDLWNVTNNLAVTYGVRVDLPSFLDAPKLNQDLLTRSIAADSTTPFRTDAKPKATPLFSPRIGFNWNVGGTNIMQVRGNIGVFTAPVPYIMIGNAYSNTGLGGVNVSCTGDDIPAFTVNVSDLPKSCANQASPTPGAAGTLGVNTIDPNFKNPQNLSASFGFDRRVLGGALFTFEGIYRKAINGVFLRDLNMRGPKQLNGQDATSDRGRVIYADAFTVSSTGSLSVDNRQQRRVLTTGANNVAFNEGNVQLTNQSADYNYNLTGQLRKRFGRGFEATAAYTFTQAKDVQSLTSDRAISNYRFGMQTSGRLDDRTNTTTSQFERPHRVLLYGTYTAPWTRNQTDVTVYFEGMSGTPLVYVVNSDVNGDGIIGNDPIYVPRDATDPSEIRIGTGSGAAFATNATAAADFNRFIDGQACLDEQRGQIMERNSCRSPWQNRMDVSFRQSLPQFAGQSVTLQLDVFNFANLVNPAWGRISLPNLSPNFNNQSVLAVRQRTAGAAISDESAFGYEFDSRLRSGRTFQPNANTATNFYQIQLSARLAF